MNVEVLKSFAMWTGCFTAVWVLAGVLLGTLYHDSVVQSDFSVEQDEALKVLVIPPAALSVLGGVVVAFTIALSKKRTIFDKLVLTRILSEAMLALDMAFSHFNNTGFCPAQAGFVSYFALVEILTVFCFSYTVFQNLVRKVPLSDLNSIHWVLQTFCLVVPIAFALPSWAIPSMSHIAGAWCWLSAEFAAWRWMFLYIPLLEVLLLDLVLFTIIFHETRKQLLRSSDREGVVCTRILKVNLSLVGILVSFGITWIWGMSYRMWNLISPEPVFAWTALSTFFVPFGGFLHMLVYLFSFKIKCSPGSGSQNRRPDIQPQGQVV